MRVLDLVLVLPLVVAACSTPTPRWREVPYVRVLADRSAEGSPCKPVDIEVVHGPVPQGMIEVARASSEAMHGMKAPLDEHERLAREMAGRFCANGVSVLQVVEDGGVVESTSLVLWKRPGS